jgi:hypothetical protein
VSMYTDVESSRKHLETVLFRTECKFAFVSPYAEFSLFATLGNDYFWELR